MSYEPIELSARIFRERYAFSPTETWDQACNRVARAMVTTEPIDRQAEMFSQFACELVTNRFMPAGRIWYGAGRPRGQLLNCFVLPTADSREGWGQTVKDMIIVSGTGGGVGVNASSIRPRGTPITGQMGTATGAVSLMDIINQAGEVIRAGGGRRTALMLCLNHDHPDTREFLDKKLVMHQLTNANVSCVFMNESPAVFFRKVDADQLHEFVWQDKVVANIPARQLWQTILDNAVLCGEPGILNGSFANAQSNIWYHKPLVSTNPCGEIWLEENGCCDLGALVLPRFVRNGKLDRTALAHTIHLAVRFLDNVLDVTTYPVPAIEANCKAVRRLGLGVMGLHDALILLGKKYTSEEGRAFVSQLFAFIKNKAYEASTFLAVERGQFPALDRHKFVESGFCKTLKVSVRERILQYGIRNCALLTIAPTGTTAMVSNVTSGIEPVYATTYRRRFRSGEGLQEEVVEHPLWAEYKSTKRAALFETALEISVKDHLAMQVTVQRHIDNAVSKTINLPKSYTGADLDPAIRAVIGKLKGVTVYRDGSRGDSPLEPVDPDCPKGVCET